MKRNHRSWTLIVMGMSAFCSLVFAQNAEKKPSGTALVRLAKMHQGGMVAEESCAIIYMNGKYRSETYLKRRTVATVGFEDNSLQASEGQLSDASLNRLLGIVGTPQFLELASPKLIRRIVDEDYDALQIMVFRQQQVQELKYPNKASRKNHQQQLKPLLEWWQELRKSRGEPVKNPQRTYCAP